MFSGVTAENYACFRVRDTGIGMTRQVKSHIFEPFFSTKERSKGRGSDSRSLRRCQQPSRFRPGRERARRGDELHRYLPVKHSLAEQPGAGGPARRAKFPQTILLVGREHAARAGISILETRLSRHAAKDGVEAVAFRKHSEEIGLVVCDLGLPRLGGREAFLKMKESSRRARHFASGYLEPTIRSEMLKAGVIERFKSPTISTISSPRSAQSSP